MNLFEICYDLKKQNEALKGSEIILAKILWDWFSWVFSDYISSILQ